MSLLKTARTLALRVQARYNSTQSVIEKLMTEKTSTGSRGVPATGTASTGAQAQAQSGSLAPWSGNKNQNKRISRGAESRVIVLGNGKDGLARSLGFRSGNRAYLFNCSESIVRQIAEYKSVIPFKSVDHILITHDSWDRTGGICGLAISTEKRSWFQDVTRIIHGSPSTEHVALESSVFDSLMRVKYDQWNFTSSKTLEDEEVVIEFVPLYAKGFEPLPEEQNIAVLSRPKRQEISSNVAVSYVCRPHQDPLKLSVQKIVELKLPRNKCLGQLQNGEEVLLPDGRLIKPSDVMLDSPPVAPFIVVDCPDERFLESLAANPKLQEIAAETSALQEQVSERKVALVVHFTPAIILKTDVYQQWMKRFPSSTTHLVLNEDAKESYYTGPYNLQTKLNLLHQRIFPLLPGQLNQEKIEEKKSEEDNILYGENGLIFGLKKGLKTQPLDRSTADGEFEELTNKQADRLKTIKEEIAEAWKDVDENDHYPETVFLGTVSTIAVKHRNVSSILVRLSEDRSILLDCGEGTLNQIKLSYGKKAPEILASIKAIFVSHAHSDHYMGVTSVVKARKEALESQGKEFTPILLLFPFFLMDLFTRMDKEVTPVLHLARMISLESLCWDKGVSFNRKGYLSRSQKTTVDLGTPAKRFEDMETIQSLLGVKEFSPIPVLHRQFPHGVIITDKTGWRLVYSGDTMPCDRLVRAGKNCDLLIHEATLLDDHEKDAVNKRHCTYSQAIDIGLRMNAKTILLTHFGGLLSKTPFFRPQNKTRVAYAFDFMRVRKCDAPLLPLLTSGLLTLFANECEALNTFCTRKSLTKCRVPTNVGTDSDIVPTSSIVSEKTFVESSKTLLSERLREAAVSQVSSDSESDSVCSSDDETRELDVKRAKLETS